MYLSIILTSPTEHEIAQKAVHINSDPVEVAKDLMKKYGRTSENVVVSVVQWNGECYDVLHKDLVIDLEANYER